MGARVLIADDHELFRDGLRLTLERCGLADEILEATTYDQALAVLTEHRDVSLALIDLGMPGLRGVGQLREVRQRFPDLKIAIHSGNERPQDIKEALGLGLSGYLLKSSPSEVTVKAVELILAGGVYVPSQAMLDDEEEPGAVSGDRLDHEAALPRVEGLTRRQTELLQLLGKGLSNAQIAHEMGISEGTVRVHVSAILRALGVPSRTRAALLANDIFKAQSAAGS